MHKRIRFIAAVLLLGISIIALSASQVAQAGVYSSGLEYVVPGAYDTESTTMRTSALVSSTIDLDDATHFEMSPDGTKVYVRENLDPDDILRQYSLSTPYDITTASLTTSRTVPNEDNTATAAIDVANDGASFYLSDDGYIDQYSITNYNISSMSYVRTALLPGFVALDTFRDIELSPDGDYLITLESNGDMKTYALSTPFNISTATLVDTFSYTSETVASVTVSEDGARLHLLTDDGADTIRIRQYNLATRYDVGSASFDGSYTVKSSNIYQSFLGGGLVHETGGKKTHTYLRGIAPHDFGQYTSERNFGDYVEVSNDGTIDNANPLEIYIHDDTFRDTDNDDILDVPSEVIVNNVPAGLTPVMTLSESDTKATLTFTGQATLHRDKDDVELTFSFQNSAFVNKTAAATRNAGSGSAYAPNMGVDFVDAPGGVLNGLSMWVKADGNIYEDSNEWGDSSNDAENGDVIEAWNDSSGNQRNFDEANIGSPVLETNSINFNPAVRFNGSSALVWKESNTLWFEGDTAQEIFSVIKPDTVGEYGWLDTDDTDDSSEQLFANMNATTGFSFGAQGTAAANSINTGGPDIRSTNPTIFSFTYDGTQSGVDNIYDAYVDGFEFPVVGSNSANGAIGTAANQFLIGNNDSGSGSAQDWLGLIPEVFQYNRVLSSDERERVHTYVSLKYGGTLDSAMSYRDTVSNVIWDAVADAAYYNDIVGIGRDDLAGFEQKVSTSFNADEVLSVALDQDFVSANEDSSRTSTFAANRSYLVIGNDNGATTSQSTEIDSRYTDRVTREWKARKSTVMTEGVILKFDGYNSDYYLVKKNGSSDFSTSVTEVGQLDSNGEISGVMFTDGDYFTLAERPADPLIELSTTTGSSTNESTADNLPSLLVDGIVTADATVEIDITGSSATGSSADYTATDPITITIPAGTYDGTLGTAVTFSGLSLNDDLLLEGDETISLTLLGGAGSTAPLVDDANGDTVTQSTFTYTITDDETATVSVSATDSVALENPAQSGQFTFMMSRLNRTGAPLNVNYTLASGGSSATPGDDYATLSGTVSIPDGSDTATVLVDTTGFDDALVEGSETVTATVTSTSTPQVTVGSPSQAVVTIYDDDSDVDGDGVPDTVEIIDSTNLVDPLDYIDTDGDLVPDYVEQNDVPATDPNDPIEYKDSDGDLVPDYVETILQPNNGQPATDENNASDMIDTDVGGVPDYVETILQPNRDQPATDPNNADDDDNDGDGISDLNEAIAPGGDGNGDGIQDALQSTVASRSNLVTGAHITLQANGDCSFVEGYSVVAESQLEKPDETFDYPVGLNDFRLRCPALGQSATVDFYYDKVYETTGWSFKKYDQNGKEYSDISNIVTFSTRNVNGVMVTVATYGVTDGGQTDVDGLVDGYINDPAGPAIALAASKVNTTANGSLVNTGAALSSIILSGVFVVFTTVWSLHVSRKQ